MDVTRRVAVLVMLPAVAAHELTHAAAALPWGRVEAVTLLPPRATLSYPAGTPRYAIRLANLAPTVLGVVIGLPALFALLTRWTLPLPALAYACGLWAVYTLPVSPEDRDPFGAGAV